MSQRYYAVLGERGVLTVGGADRRAFLQGLVSNDVERVGEGRAIWAAFLSPQGKYLHDFFIAEIGEILHLDCEGGDRLMDFGQRLSRYKLRSKVDLGIAEGMAVVALWGGDTPAALGISAEDGAARPFEGGVVFMDPRLAAAGARALLPADRVAGLLAPLGFSAADPVAYDRMRLDLGLPDGSRDLVVEKSILLESNFDRLNGVDWDKGCYMGQELTARTRYRGLVRKRLMPVAIDGPTPASGMPLMLDGTEAGEMRSSRDGLGLALVRLDRLEAAGDMPLTAGDAVITLRGVPWRAAEPAG